MACGGGPRCLDRPEGGWNRETRPYPDRLGLWPAIFLLGAFTVLELVWEDPANPGTLAQAIAVYSVATWTGMFLYGRKPWLQNGDGFSVYFGFLSRAALFGTREQDGGSTEVILRKPFSGLAHVERRAGAVGFFALMLGQVAFDGLSRSSWWFSASTTSRRRSRARTRRRTRSWPSATSPG